MAQTLIEALGANNAPPTEGVNISGNLINGVKAGVDLATAAEQVESQKTQLAEQKLKLDQSKFASFNGMMQTLNRATPQIAKAMAPQLKNRFQGMGFDPAIVDAAIADPEFGRAYVNMANALGGKVAANPEALGRALQSAQQIGELDSVVKNYGEHMKLQSEEKIAQHKDATEIQKAEINARAVQGRMSLQEERQGRMEFSRISNDTKVKPLLQQHQQGIKDMHTLEAGIDDPNGVPLQLIHELGTGLGSMIANVKTGVGERNSQQFENLKTKLASMESNATINGVPYVKDPELLKDIKTQFERLLKANEVNLIGQVDALERPTKTEYMAQQQRAAIDNLKKQIKGQDAFASSGAPPPASKDPVQIAKGLGYSQQEIDDFLAAKAQVAQKGK